VSYEDWAAKMDAAVDQHLGDTVEVSIAGGAFVPRKAFVLEENGVIGLDPIDNLAQKQRIKIDKSIVPDPGDTVRFRGAKLGADTWMPCGDVPETAGRYWLLEIQKASL
jgi:hypothetical protein